MSFSTIFAGIVAIAKAVPAFKEILDQFHDYYIDFQISKIENKTTFLNKNTTNNTKGLIKKNNKSKLT